jgi:V/A-type H+-transporting ATPase subunit I
MIVKMKKISIVAMESVREESIATLRALGVVHLSETAAKNEMVDLLENDRAILERSLSVIPDQAADAAAAIKTIKCEDCILTANMAMTLSENRRSLLEEIEKLEREAEKISIWGDFDPAEITGLRERGIDIRIYELTKNEFKKLPGTARIFIINKK